jgi:DNA repair protein RadA/Sms
MAKATHRFVCQDCGSYYSKWAGRCEGCGSWNRMVEEVLNTKTAKGSRISPDEFFGNLAIEDPDKHKISFRHKVYEEIYFLFQ